MKSWVSEKEEVESSKLGVKRKCLVLNRMDVRIERSASVWPLMGLDLALWMHVEAAGPSHLPSDIFLTKATGTGGRRLLTWMLGTLRC